MIPYARGWMDCGKGIDENPFPYKSEERREWDAGWRKRKTIPSNIVAVRITRETKFWNNGTLVLDIPNGCTGIAFWCHAHWWHLEKMRVFVADDIPLEYGRMSHLVLETEQMVLFPHFEEIVDEDILQRNQGHGRPNFS